MNIYVESCIWACPLNPILGCFWTQDLPRGGPGDHAGMVTPKMMNKSRFETLFLKPIWNTFAFVCNVFSFNVFWTSLMLDFFSQGHRKWSSLKHLEHQMQHFFAKYGKVKTAFSLERGHQNQAFQGLRFTAVYGLLMRVVETCTFYPSSEALLTLGNWRRTPKMTGWAARAARHGNFTSSLYYQYLALNSKSLYICWFWPPRPDILI